MPHEDLALVVGAIAVADRDRAERAAGIAAAIREHGGYRWVGIYEVTDTEIGILAYAGANAPAYPTFPRTEGINGSVVATGRSVVVADVTTDERYLTTFGTTRSELVVPVLDPGGLDPDGVTVIGTIDVESERVAAFGDPDRELLERCAEAITPLFHQ